jgi:hypothetical protein
MKSKLILLFILTVYSFAQQNPFYISSYHKFENPHWLFTGEMDTLTGSWSFLQPMQSFMLGVNTYYWPDSNKIFICGGMDSGQNVQSSCFAYNLVSNTYETRSPLPSGRWSGKLVRVKDSLYLVGSIDSNFIQPDGKMFRYSLNTNTWVQKSTMPSPVVQESAVCVINDSIIVLIGGSTSGFTGFVQTIRLYNPWRDRWNVIGSGYPIPVTTAHAETMVLDSAQTIVVTGGYAGIPLDRVTVGKIQLVPDSTGTDSAVVTWDTSDFSPFGGGIYRVSGGKWGDWMIFGPGLRNAANVTSLYGLRLFYTPDSLHTLIMYWTKIVPDIIDSMANIPEVAVKYGTDTSYFFYAGGFNNTSATKFSNRLKFISISGHPPPIGIQPISNAIPEKFELFQNYPNPFNPSTKIRFSVPSLKGGTVPVKLVVYDVLGRVVSTLVDDKLRAGNYEVSFDAARYASGIYFYSFSAFNSRYVRKMVLLK